MVDHKERLFECVARFDFFASCLRQGNPTIEEQMEMASDLNRATVRIAGAAYHIEQLEAALDDQIQWGDRLPYHATDRVQGALDTIEALEKRVRELEQDAKRLDWLESQHGAGLISDDFGHWAVSGSGMQNITDNDGNMPTKDKPIDIGSTFIVIADEWQGTVREALDAGKIEFSPTPPEDE